MRLSIMMVLQISLRDNSLHIYYNNNITDIAQLKQRGFRPYCLQHQPFDMLEYCNLLYAAIGLRLIYRFPFGVSEKKLCGEVSSTDKLGERKHESR